MASKKRETHSRCAHLRYDGASRNGPFQPARPLSLPAKRLSL
nr:hypothetical protein BN1235_p96 [Acinetobacter baumannii]